MGVLSGLSPNENLQPRKRNMDSATASEIGALVRTTSAGPSRNRQRGPAYVAEEHMVRLGGAFWSDIKTQAIEWRGVSPYARRKRRIYNKLIAFFEPAQAQL